VPGRVLAHPVGEALQVELENALAPTAGADLEAGEARFERVSKVAASFA
jgi:hypothetical protein